MIKIDFYSKKTQNAYIDAIMSYISKKRKSKNIKKSFYHNEKISYKKIYKYTCDYNYFKKPRKSQYFSGAVLKYFDYDKIMKIKTKNRVKIKSLLSDDLNIKVCPYCDRQYITNYRYKNESCTTADFDHFKPKKIYPNLALNLYNLIPSCQICNERMKKIKSFSIIYPFDEGFEDDCIFVLVPNNIKGDAYMSEVDSLLAINRDEKIELKINLKCDKDKIARINNSIEMFRLKDVYQTHVKFAQEIRAKRKIASDKEYIKSLNKALRGTDITIDLAPDIFIYGFNWDINGIDKERPLSKLAYDIAKR